MSFTTSRHFFLCVPAIAVLLTGAATTSAIAGAEQVGRPGTARPRVDAAAQRQALVRIRTDAEALRRAIDQTTPQGRARGNTRAAQNEEVLFIIDDVVQAANELDESARWRTSAPGDIDDLLRHAAGLDDAITTGQFRPAVTSAWTRLRSDIDALARVSSVAWDWRNPQYGSDRGSYGRLSGTYRLSIGDSDDPRAAADRVLRTVSAADRARISRQLEARLTPPEVISIDGDRTSVRIASSRGAETTFATDGQPRTEPGLGNRTATTRATWHADELEVTTSGSGSSDFSVTFQPADGGQSLLVTRRLYAETVAQPIVVSSLYRRTSNAADWNVYDSRTARTGSGRSGYGNATVIPTGTIFEATLDEALDLRTAREGNRIVLRITDASPQFRDAMIEGYVGAPTRTGTRTALAIDFDGIRWPDGRTSNFYGTIDAVRDANGRPITFDRADQTDNSRTDDAVKRGAIGAAIGAVIGAVVGGGKGAAIGAAVGAGGGAGTVLIDGQSQNTLPRGTRFTIRSGTFEAR